MRQLISYHLARILHRKSLWGILLLVAAGQLLLETQIAPSVYQAAPNALLSRFAPSGVSQERIFSICLTGSQMSLGAVYLLLGASLGGELLCPAMKNAALLPITAAGYTPRRQGSCCMLLSLLFCGLTILVIMAGEFIWLGSVLADMLRANPSLLLGLELYRLFMYLGCAGLGLLLCCITGHAEIVLPIGAMLLVAESLPFLSRICVLLPSGSISPLLFGAAPVRSMIRGIAESAVILLCCFLPTRKGYSI